MEVMGMEKGVKIGEVLKVLKFFEGKKGVGAISRLPSGKIVLVNRNSVTIPRNGEIWLCRIDFEKDKFAVVTPLTKEIKVIEKYECGHIEVKRVEAGKFVGNVKLVGGDAVVEYYYPLYCSECQLHQLSKEEDSKRAVGEEKVRKLGEEYKEWRKNFFGSQGLELRKCIEYYSFKVVKPLVTVDKALAAAIAMKTVEEEIIQKLKDKYGIDDIDELYYTDLEKYVEFYKEFIKTVEEKVQKLVSDGFVPVIVKDVEEKQKHLVDEKIAYQLKGEYAFVK
jgi:hypothetical protein